MVNKYDTKTRDARETWNEKPNEIYDQHWARW